MFEGDLVEIAHIHMACFNEEPYNGNLFYEEAFDDLKRKYEASLRDYCFVAVEDGKIIAYLITTKTSNNIIIFGPLGVKKGHRGEKLGLFLTIKAMHGLIKKGFKKFVLRIKKEASYLSSYYSIIGFEKYKEDEKYLYLGNKLYKLYKFKNIRLRREKSGGLIRFKGKYYFVDNSLIYLLFLKLINESFINIEGSKKKIEELKNFLEKKKITESNTEKKPKLRFPLKIRIEVTSKCNNRCVWCYANSRYNQNGLSKEEFKEIIKKLAYNGIFEITFSGGEPTLNPSLLDLISYANSFGIITHLITNGTMLTEEYVKRLEKSGLKSVQISIEGLEKTHNFTTRNNSFNKCVEGIRNCLNSKIHVSTNTTISSINYLQVKEVIEFLRSLGVKYINFNYVTTNGDNLKISKEELIEVMRKVSSYNNKNLHVNWLGVFEKCYIDTSKFFKRTNVCSACNTSITISSNGLIRPCSFSTAIIGDVKKDSIRKIWQSEYCERFRSHEIIKSKCYSCPILKECKGGCMLEELKEYLPLIENKP